MRRLAAELESRRLLEDEEGKPTHWQQCSPYIALEFCVWALAAMGPYLWSTVLFAETSFFTDALPEKKLISDYVSVLTQLTVCVFVPSFIFLQSIFKQRAKLMAVLVMVAGLAASLLSAFFWDAVHTIAGTERSLGLLLCVLLGGSIAALSAVSIWPLAAERGLLMISAVVTGVGLTQVLGVVLGVVQGAGDHARFSPRTFFLIAAGLQVLSLVVFVAYLALSRPPEEQPLYVTVNDLDHPPREDEGESVSLWEALSVAKYGVAHSAFINLLHGSVQGTMAFRFTGWHGLSTLLHTASMCALAIGASVPILTIFVRVYRISLFSFLLTVFWIPLFLFSFLDKAHLATGGAYALLAVNILFGSLFSFSDIMILLYTTKTVPLLAQRRATRLVGAARQIGTSVAALLTLALVIWFKDHYGDHK